MKPHNSFIQVYNGMDEIRKCARQQKYYLSIENSMIIYLKLGKFQTLADESSYKRRKKALYQKTNFLQHSINVGHRERS